MQFFRLRPSAAALTATLALATSMLRPTPASAASPFLVVPDPAVVEASPAYRYANMSNEEAFAELDRRQIGYQLVEHAPGVRAPIRLTDRLHGVYIHSSLPAEQRATTMFEILDARLALALDDFAEVLERHDIDEVVHYTMYRPNVAPPGQASHASVKASSPAPLATQAAPSGAGSTAGASTPNQGNVVVAGAAKAGAPSAPKSGASAPLKANPAAKGPAGSAPSGSVLPTKPRGSRKAAPGAVKRPATPGKKSEVPSNTSPSGGATSSRSPSAAEHEHHVCGPLAEEGVLDAPSGSARAAKSASKPSKKAKVGSTQRSRSAQSAKAPASAAPTEATREPETKEAPSSEKAAPRKAETPTLASEKEPAKKAEAPKAPGEKEHAKKAEASTPSSEKEHAKKAEAPKAPSEKEHAKKAEASAPSSEKLAAKKAEATTPSSEKQVAKKAETSTPSSEKQAAKKAEAASPSPSPEAEKGSATPKAPAAQSTASAAPKADDPTPAPQDAPVTNEAAAPEKATMVANKVPAQPAPAARPRPKWAPPGTRHPAGLAIDVGALRKRDGTWLRVANHFHGRRGERTCGATARVPERSEAQELRAIACEAMDLGIFTYTLTPNYDVAHEDHFHMEIKPGVRWFLVH
ncbi:extensin family protein [Chondromyces crocatus]|uniref:Extensin-like C-terminal domain-containing protein n=1 Tax=Chondromyces crocatus TaxID=52 RepID=A0A0K1EU34_CHOCO|nr:extensin family protein [Chondromyces crocatus]AKT44157.1 uncharacterized protein CMC5_083970 [Chondromyces crocatus]